MMTIVSDNSGLQKGAKTLLSSLMNAVHKRTGDLSRITRKVVTQFGVALVKMRNR